MTDGPPVACRYFDGRTTTPHAVTLRVDGDEAWVVGDGVDRRVPLAEVRVSERMGASPRLVSFMDGAYCEVTEHAGLDALLADTGFRTPMVARLQSRWPFAIGAVAICAGLVALGYVYLLPWAAEQAADHIPASTMETLSTQTLEAMDSHLFKASALPAARQDALTKRFALLQPPDGRKVPHQIVFRDAGPVGANAFALPNGTIVVTDDLVTLADTDDQILAVLSHELGHVQRRHAMRQILQGSVVGLVVTWYLGDISSLVAAVPAALLQARYSRDLEREADDYGASLLRYNGLSPSLLASMLEKLEDARHPGSPGDAARDDKATGYLSSHPATAERIARLRGSR